MPLDLRDFCASSICIHRHSCATSKNLGVRKSLIQNKSDNIALVWDQRVEGSNPFAPTIIFHRVVELLAPTARSSVG